MRYFIILLFVMVVFLVSNAEARSIPSFTWEIDEKYHRDGSVHFVVEKGTQNYLPIGIKGLSNVTVNLHPTINFDQTGPAKLPRGIDIYFEPNTITVTADEVKTVKLVIDVDENASSNLYDVQIIGTWKDEGKIPDFMGSSIRLHVGRDFGDGKIPVNMLDPPTKFWKLIQIDGGALSDVPCRNDYVLVVKSSTKTPACVTYGTGVKLIERGWGMCLDEFNYNRGHPCGPRSSPGIPYDKHSGPEDLQTEITGADAWAICGALKIPCPSNPVFRGGKLDEITKSVSYTTPNDLYEILLNKTHICVTSTQAKSTECSLR